MRYHDHTIYGKNSIIECSKCHEFYKKGSFDNHVCNGGTSFITKKENFDFSIFKHLKNDVDNFLYMKYRWDQIIFSPITDLAKEYISTYMKVEHLQARYIVHSFFPLLCSKLCEIKINNSE